MAFKAILQLFEVVSGLKVNFHKSQLVRVNVEVDWLFKTAFVLDCTVSSIPFHYLGIPIGANPRRKSMWEPVVEKVR